ncbi:hypothetical protein DYB37_010358 [Aphanomyces astaci]|uniref:Uncharacterized protein n=1 Tax=Aphanomyces astaci TaxID=112090 RepID=A0A3L6VGP3_APHAT|nr:hypothetical protein DYB35_009968 [Aphanomyces astaci]RHZ12341.1 hypothetical protein DYB37_010358 [Aphanomyces astaci]RLO07887.1 hypothetical protein DYB28_006934 [Aphanomyces astaci]
MALIYTVLNRGDVVSLNLFKRNRVSGVVWVGRTVLFIRSMPAIFLLSNQVLVLEPLNFVYHFVSATTVLNESVTTDQFIRYAKIFLAASEVS